MSDQQGSVRVLLDDAGNAINQISYDSFGNITNETDPTVDFRFAYTGRELDSETGQYYYRARYYDPATGRFINEDLIGFEGGDTNLYRYVGNSPTLYVDPSGEAITLALISGVIISTVVTELLLSKPVQAPTDATDKFQEDSNMNLKRAGLEFAIETIVEAPTNPLGIVDNFRSFAKPAGKFVESTVKGIDNFFPRDLGSIPIPVEGFLREAFEQTDEFIR